MKKLLCCILAVLMLAGALTLTSCGNNTDEDETKANAETTAGNETAASTETEADTRVYADIPTSYDYNGEVISVLGWINSAWESMARTIRDVVAESINGDVVNDAVFMRNARISDSYNVSFEYTSMTLGNITSVIGNNVAAGSHVYDYVYPNMRYLGDMINGGYLTNFYDVPNMDLSKPWYDQDAIEYLGVGSVLFAVSTAASINDKDATAAIAFNKSAAQDYDLPDLYQTVRDGDWTIEELYDETMDVLTDLDGNDTYDEADFYGFLGKHDVAASFKTGAGCMIITKDSDGYYEFTLGDEYDEDVSELVMEFMSEKSFYNHHVTGIDDTEFTNMFATGHGLFFWMRMDEVTNLRSSEVDFGILPIPKYDDDQENYLSYVSIHTGGLLTIPLTNTGDRLEMTGMILEALSADSLYGLQPAYIDQALTTKYARDEESGDMIQLILAHRVFDPGMMYSFGNFNDIYLYQYTYRSQSLTTLVARYKSAVDTAVEKFNDRIRELEK